MCSISVIGLIVFTKQRVLTVVNPVVTPSLIAWQNALVATIIHLFLIMIKLIYFSFSD